MTDALSESAGRHRQRVMNLRDTDDVKFRLFDRAIDAAKSSRRAVSGTLLVLAVLVAAMGSAWYGVNEVLDRLNY